MKKEFFQKLPKWLKSNVFYRAELSTSSGDTDGFNKELHVAHPLDANLISSEKANGRHVLMLDLDEDHIIYPSSSLGNSHLYIDADLTLEDLKEIIDVLVKHGILQEGIKKQLDSSNCLTLRPPGVKKGNQEDSAGLEKYKQLKAQQIEAEQEFEPVGMTVNTNFHPNGLASNELKNKLTDLKKAMTPTSSKQYEAAYAIKNGSYVVMVDKERLSDTLNAMAIKLGMNLTVIHGTYDPLLGLPGAAGSVNYKGRKLANVHYNFAAQRFILEFRQEFIDFKGSDIDVPLGWPKWDDLVKVMSQIGEK